MSYKGKEGTEDGEENLVSRVERRFTGSERKTVKRKPATVEGCGYGLLGRTCKCRCGPRKGREREGWRL